MVTQKQNIQVTFPLAISRKDSRTYQNVESNQAPGSNQHQTPPAGVRRMFDLGISKNTKSTHDEWLQVKVVKGFRPDSTHYFPPF